jgi:hypothetical protein
VKDIRLNLLLPPLVFVASAIVAVFNADAAALAWLLLVPVYILRRRNEVALGVEVPDR